MPERVRKAPHLGVLLEAKPRTDIEGREGIHDKMAAWRQQAIASRRATDNDVSPAKDGAGHPLEAHHFQEEFVKTALALRDKGLPPGQP